MPRTEPARTVKTAATVFDIIDVIQDLNQATATEVAQRLGIAISTAYDHLATLEQRGLLVEHSKGYRLGLKFLDYGMDAKRNVDLSQIVQSDLEKIAEETGRVAWFIIEENNRAVYLNKAKGENAIQTAGQTGKHWPLHCLAAGKLFLADRSNEEVRAYVDEYGLPRYTEHTITDVDELFDRLDQIRERGYAYHDQEAIPDWIGAAAPITQDGKTRGAISTGGPLNRLNDDDEFTEELPQIVTGAAIEVEFKLQYPNQDTPV